MICRSCLGRSHFLVLLSTGKTGQKLSFLSVMRTVKMPQQRTFLPCNRPSFISNELLFTRVTSSGRLTTTVPKGFNHYRTRPEPKHLGIHRGTFDHCAPVISNGLYKNAYCRRSDLSVCGYYFYCHRISVCHFDNIAFLQLFQVVLKVW